LSKKVTVLFQPSGRKGGVEAGKNILQAAQELGVEIESLCGGKQICGKCRVLVEEDFFERETWESKRRNLSPFTAEEGKFIGEQERQAGYRLACATELWGDALVYLPEETRRKQQVIRKEAREIPVHLNPAVKSYYVELPPPSLQEPLGDFERLRRALQNTFALSNLSVDYPVLQTLPRKLRDGNWKVTAFVWMGREVLDVQPGRVENFYGLAVDIGTTTLAVYLCNLKNGKVAVADSMMNPQVLYGEDVMSRITYAMMNPGDGLRRLQGAVTESLNELIGSVSQTAAIVPEDILEVVVVGNTAMHHIFLGIEPHSLGLSPFPPAVHHSLNIKARDLGLKVHPGANVHVLPIEAGFVGADNVGVLIAQPPYEREETTLIIDIGTNGELALGSKRRLVSSSCATGPALEGAQLRFGMRAAAGAIERVRIDPQTFEVKYKTIGREKWSHESSPDEIQARGICGSGIIEVVAEMFKAGVLEKNGRFNAGISCPRLRKGEKSNEFVIARAEETAIGQDITVSIADVQAVQLAKAALYAGAKVMMGVLRIERLNRVILAGAFGSSIDRERAMALGMFPDCPLENVFSVGNAAGDGARLALLNFEKRAEADRVAREAEYVELTTSPNFTQEFVAAMAIPHSSDAFPHLESFLKTRG
jgi:uncharacterized 2Fe-2S/4Fe-4S cluster protein (DUF4445 family)